MDSERKNAKWDYFSDFQTLCQNRVNRGILKEWRLKNGSRLYKGKRHLIQKSASSARPPASAFQSSKSFWLLQNWNVHPIPRFFYGEKSCLIFLLQIKARVTTLRLFSSFLYTRNVLNSAKGWTHSTKHKWLLHMLRTTKRRNKLFNFMHELLCCNMLQKR